MQNSQNTIFSELNNTFKDNIVYLPAKLSERKSGWIIEYWVINPETGKLVRKRSRVDAIRDRFKTKKEARNYFDILCANINGRLAGGWNPLFSEETSRLLTPIEVVLDLFLNDKKKELRENTMRSYKSFCSMLIKWIESNGFKIASGRFNKILALKYMNYVYNERNVSNRSYNNTLKLARSVFNWMQEQCYVKDNPFEQIKTKRTEEKKRILIDKETRHLIFNYFEEKQSNFKLVCCLVYSSLIRPKEIAHIQIKHIDLANHCIMIPAANAKNHHTKYSAITPLIEKILCEMQINKFPGDYYLLGAGYTPSQTMINESRLRKNG